MDGQRKGILYHLNESVGTFWGVVILFAFAPFIIVIILIEVLLGFDEV